MSRTSLPEEFKVLEEFLPWAQSNTENERSIRRHTADIEDMRRFYDVMAPLMGDVYDYLRSRSVDDLDDQSEALFYLALALADVSIAVENFGQPTSPIGYDHEQITIHQ